MGFLDGGASANKQKVEEMGDLQELVHRSETSILVKSGNMTEAEGDAYLREKLAENEENVRQQMSDVDKMAATNVAINLACIGLSCIGGKSALSSAAKKGTAEAGKQGAKAAGKAVLQNGGDDVVKAVLQNGGDDMVRAAVQNGGDDLLKAAVKNGGDDIVKAAVKNGGDDLVKAAVKEGGDDLVKAAVKEGGDDAAKAAVEAAAKEGGEGASKWSLKGIARSVGDKTKDAGRHAVEAVKGAVTKENAKSAARTAAKGVQTAAKGTGKAVGLAGKGYGGFINLVGKLGGAKTIGGVTKYSLKGNAIRLAVTAAPIAAGQIYTRSRTAEQAAELDDAIGALNAAHAYLTSSDESLTEEMQQAYAGWTESYEAGSAELLAKYDAGEITKAEYDAAYEAHIKSSKEQFDALGDQHKEMGRNIVEHGAAYAVSEDMIKTGTDPEMVRGRSEYIDGVMENNPEAYEAAKVGYETRQKLETGSTFTNWLANMNASLLHYLPGAAYLEAVAIKAADVAMDFIANKVPVLSDVISYEEKHEGRGIGDIARTVLDNAEERYALKEEQKSLQAAVADQADYRTQSGTGPEEQDDGPARTDDGLAGPALA